MLPPPGSLVLQDTDVRTTFYGWGYIQTCLGVETEVEWKHRMEVSHDGGWGLGGGNAKLNGKTSDWSGAEQVIGSLSLLI